MRTSSRKLLWTACFGNLFEHYDTALFGFLSPFLAPLIFPEQDPLTALILTYAIIPLGMLARPIGSLVFGYIGDAYGRQHALFLTLAGMSFVSACFAFAPTYLHVGILAPILFCIGRALQNFLAAGETMGGAIFVLENTSEKRHDLLSSLYSSSALGGHLLASLGVFLLSSYHMIDPGWRFLYLCGCITGVFGCMIRRSSGFVQSSQSQTSLKFSQSLANLKDMFWIYRKQLLLIAVTAGFANATYSIALVFMNGFVPLVSSLTKAEMMKVNTYLLVFDLCAFPFFGWVASKISREKQMLLASLGVLLFSAPLCVLLKEASLVTVIGIRVAFVLSAAAFFAPFHAWAQQLVPSTCRYAVISFGYALGTQLLGSPTAALALWSFQKTGMIASVAWYWMGLALASSLAIAMALRSRSRDILDHST